MFLQKYRSKGYTIEDQINRVAHQFAENESTACWNPVLGLEHELQIISDQENEKAPLVQAFLQIPMKDHGLLLKQFIYEWQNMRHIQYLRPMNRTLNRFNEMLLLVNQQAITKLPVGYRSVLNVFDTVYHSEPSGIELSAILYLKSPTTVDFALTYLNQLVRWG